MVQFHYLQKFLLSTILLLSVYLSAEGQTQTVGTFINDNNSYNGYTLFNPIGQTNTYLIDNCGNLVHSWNSSYVPKLSVYLMENGNLLRTCTVNYPEFGGRLEILDWESQVVWEYNFSSDDFYLHHDVEAMPNGNILLISYDVFTPVEAIQAGRNPATLGDEIYAEKIIEIKPIGTDSMEVVWEWKAWDHLIQDFDPAVDNYGVVADNPGLFDINYSVSVGPNANLDWMHFNSLAYNEELDQIMVSSRNLSEIYIIDHSTTTAESAGDTGGIYGHGGNVLYRYGNPAAYDRGTTADRKFFFQHDARWITYENHEKFMISVFNNQVTSTTSSVVLFTPPVDSAGYYKDPGTGAYRPDSYNWSFESTEIHSKKISGAQRLTNGNTLICAGVLGTFIEVDKAGNIVWKYVNPVGGNGPVNQGEIPTQNRAFKINRYTEDYAGFAEQTLISGDPLELNPLPSTCMVVEDTTANIRLTVFLEGAFESGEMNTALSDNDLLPNKQPFSSSPWNYFGTENFDILPNDSVVDWILVDIRDADMANTAFESVGVARKAALLLSNGEVVSVDGSPGITFNNSYSNKLFVTIYHRNHLGVLSSMPLSEEATQFNYNFSQSQDAVYGGANGHLEVETGIWGMISGDANADGTVNLVDKTSLWDSKTGINGYQNPDLNLDGETDNIDKNDYWLPNLNESSQIPVETFTSPVK